MNAANEMHTLTETACCIQQPQATRTSRQPAQTATRTRTHTRDIGLPRQLEHRALRAKKGNLLTAVAQSDKWQWVGKPLWIRSAVDAMDLTAQ
jgi:hypothetical protein